MDSWEDKATGQKRTRLKVVGEAMQFLGSAQGGGGDRGPAGGGGGGGGDEEGGGYFVSNPFTVLTNALSRPWDVLSRMVNAAASQASDLICTSDHYRLAVSVCAPPSSPVQHVFNAFLRFV
jgi:single-stranded DNA-binding protein